MSEEQQLAILPAKEVALAVFSAPNGLDPYLQSVREAIDKFNASAPDVKTKKGQDAYRSIAYSLAGSKTKLDSLGKELVAELKDAPKKIDAERKRVRELLTTWQTEVRKPLTDWEDADKARIEGHKESIDWLANRDDGLADLTSSQIALRIDEAESFEIGIHLEEFEVDAARAKDAVLAKLRPALTARQAHEVQLAEIAKFNADKAEREQKERDAEIAKAAVENARREADEAAQLQRETAAKREQALLDQAAEAEQALKQAEIDRVAAVERAERDRVEADQRQTAAVERARLDEIARQEAAADEILRQERLREADKEHKKTICLAAQKALMAGGINEDVAKAVIILIHQRKIPAVSIAY